MCGLCPVLHMQAPMPKPPLGFQVQLYSESNRRVCCNICSSPTTNCRTFQCARGVNHLVIQHRLLAEKDDTALNLAKSLEAAEKGSHDITLDNKFEPVAFQLAAPTSEEPSEQLRGGRGDMASICCFKDQDCHKCKKRGHTAKVCRSSQLTKISRKQTKTHFVNQDYTCIYTHQYY